MNVLFICSRNQWRSPTAETIWRRHPDLNVRSAGTSPRAKKTVNDRDIGWADVVFAMERKHRSRLRAMFDHLLHDTPIIVLDIPDEYQYMDPELVEELQTAVNAHLSQLSLRTQGPGD